MTVFGDCNAYVFHRILGGLERFVSKQRITWWKLHINKPSCTSFLAPTFLVLASDRTFSSTGNTTTNVLLNQLNLSCVEPPVSLLSHIHY